MNAVAEKNAGDIGCEGVRVEDVRMLDRSGFETKVLILNGVKDDDRRFAVARIDDVYVAYYDRFFNVRCGVLEIDGGAVKLKRSVFRSADDVLPLGGRSADREKRSQSRRNDFPDGGVFEVLRRGEIERRREIATYGPVTACGAMGGLSEICA